MPAPVRVNILKRQSMAKSFESPDISLPTSAVCPNIHLAHLILGPQVDIILLTNFFLNFCIMVENTDDCHPNWGNRGGVTFMLCNVEYKWQSPQAAFRFSINTAYC
jgi:hypothetical protein